MENFLNNIDDQEAFKSTVKAALDQRAFETLDALKKEMAGQFLTQEEDE